MVADTEIPFTKQMRIATREIHNVSDALVNAKLGIGCSDNRVWAEGLLVYYEVFSFMEGAMDRLSHTLIGDLDIPGMRRKEAFEKDLSFYLGPKWKEGYSPRESVCKYLQHVKNLEANKPYLLMAHIYHFYMGLLSGGQIMRRQRALMEKFKFSRKETGIQGLAVTEVTNVSKIKTEMAEAMNRIAGELDEETRQGLIEESKMVFVLSNSMVQSIEGAGAVVAIKMVKWAMYGMLGVLLAIYVKKWALG